MRCSLVCFMALCWAATIPASAQEYRFRGLITQAANIYGLDGDLFSGVNLPFTASLTLGGAEGAWEFGFVGDFSSYPDWDNLESPDFGDSWHGGPGANRNEVIDTPTDLSVDFYLQTGDLIGAYRGFRLSLAKDSSAGTWEWGSGTICAVCDHPSTDPYAFAEVHEFRMTSGAQAGDFNNDGAVNAADYAVWRNGVNAWYGQSDYAEWRDNYGAGAGANPPQPVPEPAWLGVIASGFALTRRRSRQKK